MREAWERRLTKRDLRAAKRGDLDGPAKPDPKPVKVKKEKGK